MASTRRLAAILAADVAGYSRLMGVDEEGTLERLKAHRPRLIDPKIGEHRRRIVKTTGDGLLAEFASVVDAVRCAAEVRRGMLDREPDLPDERRIRLRIGINLGDVIVDGDDIFGDGVNVAARLEGLTEPGGICRRRGLRPDPRQAPLPARGQGRAERQEYRAARAGLCAAPRSHRRPAGIERADRGAASPSQHGYGNSDDCSGGADCRRRRVVDLADNETRVGTGNGSRPFGPTAPSSAAPVDRRAALR